MLFFFSSSFFLTSLILFTFTALKPTSVPAPLGSDKIFLRQPLRLFYIIGRNTIASLWINLNHSLDISQRLGLSSRCRRMDHPPASSWSEVCMCGRAFSVPQAYTLHLRSCKKTKKRLAGALEKAKATWQANKRRKVEETVGAQNMPVARLDPIDDPEPIPTLGTAEVRHFLTHLCMLNVINNFH
jgi:hypothetical protein